MLGVRGGVYLFVCLSVCLIVCVVVMCVFVCMVFDCVCLFVLKGVV